MIIGGTSSGAGAEVQEDALPEEEKVTFQIREFSIEGNTLLDDSEIERAISIYKGKNKTDEDVERARSDLESLYHRKGYPTVLVNIPEQTVEKGVIRIEVIESRIGTVTITGNEYVTKKKILRQLSGFHPGAILYMPTVQEQLGRISSNPDLQVKPVLIPTRELDIIDVELKVQDRLPVHGSFELNNRSTHTTPDLRTTASLRYDNLWQQDHSLAVQYQTSPEEPDEVQSVYISYVLSPPWDYRQGMAFYHIKSDSETTTAGDIQVLGKGRITGFRYLIPFPASERCQHTASLGIDYKDFDETIGFKNNDNNLKTPIQYAPLFLSYSASLPDSHGSTTLSTSFNMVFRGLLTEQKEFEAKRYQAKGNYLFLTAKAERSSKLPGDAGLLLRLDGQLANQPLISNEQYPAGGVDNLRGYKESEELGDNAIHFTLEMQSPNLFQRLGFRKAGNLTLHAFYDGAILQVLDRLSEDSEGSTVKSKNAGITLQGVGAGLRGGIGNHFKYGFDWGVALNDTDLTEKGDTRMYFNLLYQF